MQIAANVNPGSSGGPVLNGSGQVVGVIVMKANGEGESFLRDASRQFDSPALSNSRNAAQGVALAIPGSVLIEKIKDAQNLSSETARIITQRHDALAVVGRSLNVAGFDYLRMFGNAPRRVIAESQSRRSRNPNFVIPPAQVLMRIREVTHLPEFTQELGEKRKQLNEKLTELANRNWIDEDAQKTLRELRAVLSRLKKFADKPSGTYTQFERSATELGTDLQRLAVTLQISLREGQTI